MGKVNDAAVLSDEVTDLLGPGPFRDLLPDIQTDEVDALPGFHLFSGNDPVRIFLVHGQGHLQTVVVRNGDAVNAPIPGPLE
jgi:hypothetical protein